VNFVKRVFLFLALNFLIVISMSIMMAIFGTMFGVQPYLQQAGLDYVSLAIYCLIYGSVASIASLFFSKAIAKSNYGVQLIDERTGDPQLRELVNIVYGLAKQVGIKKMPEVGIYNSGDINAFATGFSKNSALVAVSTGLLNYMDRDEIEGVLGHEISHVANGDMVTMALLQAVVNAFTMFLSRVIAFVITRRGDREENNRPGLVYYLVTWVLDFVFMTLGSILVAAYSRHREFRADAGGAKLAGPRKMQQALEKLRQQFEHIQPVAGSASALMISNKPIGLIERLFSSHPPLDERIKRLSELK
jgi:heat shock protein HtpX